MDSIATREAAQAAQAASAAWRDHRRGCPSCDRAARSRHPREMCARGRGLNEDRAAADTKLRREKAADKAPNPDQPPLFALPGGKS